MRSTAIAISGLGNPKPHFFQTRHNDDFSLLREWQARGWFDDPDETRHNIGFRVIDAIAGKAQFNFNHRLRGETAAIMLAGNRVVLVRPMTGMNTSGVAVKNALKLNSIQPADMLLVYDDTDLPLGQLRFQRGEKKETTGARHNGVKSVFRELGSNEFDRLKVGVGPVPKGVRLLEFVLTAVPPVLHAQYKQTIATSAEAARVWAEHGIQAAMNRYHSR